MINVKKCTLFLLIFIFIVPIQAQAAKLAIIIDDIGYVFHQDKRVLNLPKEVSISILPNAPNSKKMAELAHAQGREILIHLPMQPIGSHLLEKNTIKTDMDETEIKQIIHQAVLNVPYAQGLNNHMGSAMTSSFSGMQKVMRCISEYSLYFVDSKTINTSKALEVAKQQGIPALKRDIFLDNELDENKIRAEFKKAIKIARKRGFAVVIGHPHSLTLRVLAAELQQIPKDIQLVAPSYLLQIKNKESHAKMIN